MSEDALVDHLVKSYEQLRKRLRRHLGSDELVRDALQDTWLRLHRMDSVGMVKNPHAFLLRMAVNIAVDHQRSRSRAVPRAEADALLEVSDPGPGPEQSVEEASEVDRLFQLIDRLPRRRREVLILVRWEEMPQKEVAELLGISLRTVEYELKAAQEHIAAHMTRGRRK